MDTNELQRRQLIEHLLTQQPDINATQAINLWQPMAAQIVAIVGEGGFKSLFARCIFLSQSTFPWLAACGSTAHGEERFAHLQSCFETQTPAQIRAANGHLLITFTNILASLIGDKLTTRILSSAWLDALSDSANNGVRK